MQINLDNRTALVTAATKGIGLAIAVGLRQAGATVTISGRSAQSVEAALQQINQQPGPPPATGVVADPGTAEGAATLIAVRPEVDILVNNLGIYGAVPFFEIDDAQWQTMMEVNLLSGVRLARHYARGMQQRGWGRIQFISSESALNIPAEMVHYGVSKAAMQGLARGLAKVLAGSGVTVNTILPGPTRTEGAMAMMAAMAAERGSGIEQMEQRFLQENRPSGLLGRFATPEEVAAMSVYVASPQASATTGAALRVDGGIVESIA